MQKCELIASLFFFYISALYISNFYDEFINLLWNESHTHLNARCSISPQCLHRLYYIGQPMVLAATQVILSTSNYISACCSMLRCHGDGRRGPFYLKTLINSPISLTRMEPRKIQQDNETKIKYMPQDHHNTKPLWSSSGQCWQIGSLTCRGIIKWN